MSDRDDLQPCDMIMKGGLTSGVVYPGTIRELAKSHRFVNLGGASAGAIGAAAAAACEYHRLNQPDGTPGGFERLDALPTELGQSMLHMIQPAAPLARFWDFVIDEMRRSGEGGTGRVAMLARLVLTATKARLVPALAITAAVVIVAVLLALLGGGWIAFAILAAVLALLALDAVLVMRFLRDTKDAIEANNLGICDGHTPRPGATVAPITDWIDDLFSECATGTKGTVLTIGDLWGPEGVRAYRAAIDAGTTNPVPPAVARTRSIDLQVMATNYSMGRPHRFPLEMNTFFWCERCWSSYFTDAVLDRLKWNHTPEEDGTTTIEPIEPTAHKCPEHPGESLRYLPGEADLPLIVGVRVSLSFPLLFSAVPFYTVDRNRKSDQQGIERIWLADGGMSSNFPMHFFDSLVPSRPTFGISLEPEHPDFPGQEVYCPTTPRSGGHSLRITNVTTLGAMLKAIIKTMQNWADNTLLTLPGYRERVVQVRLASDEGGFNFTMPPETISELSRRGALAAEKLEHFDMDTHRWARYLSSMSLLQGAVLRIDDVAADVEVGDPPVELNAPSCEHRYMPPPSAEWIERNQAGLAALRGFATTLRDELDEPFGEHHPRPTPDLQVSPRI